MERTRPGSKGDLSLTSSGGQRRRTRREATPTKDDDLFLELAKDSRGKADIRSYTSQDGTPEDMRNHNPFSKSAVTAKQYPSSLSLVESSPRPPSTAPPVSSQRYFRNYPRSSLSPEPRRASAGEANAFMRPFKPSYRPSNLSILANDSPRSEASAYSQTTDTTIASPATPSYADDIESVGSATAVSTVWDDAQDLKSKIKQYRSSSRRIRSSGTNLDEAIERPRTATTMTTNSSASNQMKRVTSGQHDGGRSDDNAKHQLLRTALQRLRGQVDANVYCSLESSVADVISASTVLDIGDNVSMADNASTVTGPGSSDRRLRRKVDSLCQSLTELCIALSDSNDHNTTLIQSPTSIDRPLSHGSASRQRDSDSPVSYLDERRARLGSSSRAPSRISEAPESTAHTFDTSKPSHSIRQYTASRQPQPQIFSRRLSTTDDSLTYRNLSHTFSRTATSTVLSGSQSQDASSSDRDRTVRAPSRAATEIGGTTNTSSAIATSFFLDRQQSRDLDRSDNNTSRAYVDYNPLPDTMLPVLRKSLATNHNNASNMSLNSEYSAATWAGDGWARAAGSSLLQERLEKRRLEMAVESAGLSGGLDNGARNGRSHVNGDMARRLGRVRAQE